MNTENIYDSFTKKIISEGGATMPHFYRGTLPLWGYYVALDKKFEEKIPRSRFSAQDAIDYSIKYFGLLHGDNLHLGGWMDGDTVYLDISEHIVSYREAEQLSKERGQLAFYDIKNKKSIYV